MMIVTWRKRTDKNGAHWRGCINSIHLYTIEQRERSPANFAKFELRGIHVPLWYQTLWEAKQRVYHHASTVWVRAQNGGVRLR